MKREVNIKVLKSGDLVVSFWFEEFYDVLERVGEIEFSGQRLKNARERETLEFNRKQQDINFKRFRRRVFCG